MSSYKIARRAFLRSCGGSAALLLPLLRSIEARAQGVAAPLRFLVIHHPQGSPLTMWRPAVTATTTAFTLPVNSAPFAPLQSKMVMIDGLNVVSASRQPGNTGGTLTSEGGLVAVMTGVPTLGQIGQQDHAAGGSSIDQILLDRSPILGGSLSPSASHTVFQSLQVAADVRSDRDEIAPRVLSYRPPTANPDINLARQPMYPRTQPLDVFNLLFGQGVPPAASAGLLARELSVLDFMRGDLARLQKLIPASEKPKLDIHATAIQQLEQSIRAAMGAPVCGRPATPPQFVMSGKGASGGEGPIGGSKLTGVDYYDPADPNNHPHQVLGRTHLSIMKAAFACDLLRVGTFSWGAATSWVTFPGHMGDAVIDGGYVSAPHYPVLSVDPIASPGTFAWWGAIDRFYSEQTAQAIMELATTPDIDGNMLLDNTVVVYLSELARRWDHLQFNVPVLVFGGKNTRIKGGTFLKITDGPLPKQGEGVTAGSTGTGNRPFNDLWLALAPIFGVALSSLGAPTQYTGPLPGLVV
jgi:Protein of unknown function (DUF1552)